ncbi:precorrin-6y C5,15-methyltransferase (decarboxylating) subunit CbiE [Pelagibacterium sp. H642]|uniref:precorrin-6y C5,15-methyltransferase (decarboxylating) subunit CbiE n=1 Tax=Pelagibacterium sp. H642 TaxID=1881069 RepID=UPI002814B4B9|nr:precorrin-6y C5,15-methyltransferase (decarboxylating) subunit CbiE [Pelagibacterium sp. H642]WMT91058.1 precorrin-6y C5,15-methyltransferase (decarboxylating) subunit CbiE [Pelagibacterium sp. H642]
MTERWLTIVGIGEDGLDGLTDLTKSLIADAEVVFGGARHLALVRRLNLAEQRRWQSPIETSVEEVARLRGRKRVCVLASGDPFHFGIGATLARRIPAREMQVVTSPSSFSLAAARMGWALQDVTVLSLHGRPIELIRPHLHHGRKVLALTSDEKGPGEVAALLVEAGFGASAFTVLEALGGPNERLKTVVASGFDMTGIDPLNIVAIDVVAGADARVLPMTPGVPDEWFDHDGQITKREIRALTLSALAPRRGELLWDIGAGSGSVGIEWMLADPSLSAIAVEVDGTRLKRIAGNAAALGVPGLVLKQGKAPQVLEKLPPPDAIFVGGGGTDDGVIDAAMEALKPGGRLVVNAVTLEMEALLALLYGQAGGSLTRIQIARAEALGSMSGWRPAMPITQWVWHK